MSSGSVQTKMRTDAGRIQRTTASTRRSVSASKRAGTRMSKPLGATISMIGASRSCTGVGVISTNGNGAGVVDSADTAFGWRS